MGLARRALYAQQAKRQDHSAGSARRYGSASRRESPSAGFSTEPAFLRKARLFLRRLPPGAIGYLARGPKLFSGGSVRVLLLSPSIAQKRKFSASPFRSLPASSNLRVRDTLPPRFLADRVDCVYPPRASKHLGRAPAFLGARPCLSLVPQVGLFFLQFLGCSPRSIVRFVHVLDFLSFLVVR